MSVVRNVDVVYLYEHAARELDVACAVTAHLRKNCDISVEIIHWPTGFPGAVTQIRPSLVILPFCYSEESYRSLLAYWRAARFFNITWEQLFYLGNQKAKTPRGEFALNHVIHHAWSETYASFLTQHGVRSGNVFLNGHPAYTLYDQPYRAYFASRAELAVRYGLDPSRRWIFFPENYNWAFYSRATIQQFIDNGQSAEDVEAMREYCDLSLRDVILWLAEAARSGQVEVVLRPRPSVALDQFLGVMKNILPEAVPHLHVIQQESVREWILACDIVFSSHSTSLIEAALAGRPVFMVEPHPIPAMLKVGWHDLLPHIQTGSQFTRHCLGNDQIIDDRLAVWTRRTLMSRGDSIYNLADFIASLLDDKSSAAQRLAAQRATPAAGWIPPAPIWSFYRRLKQLIRHGKTDGIEPEYAKDRVEPKIIEANIQKWTRLLTQAG